MPIPVETPGNDENERKSESLLKSDSRTCDQQEE